jgi:hypothetical protein
LEDGSVCWNAALISTSRVNGQPRHKHLASLAGLAEADAKANAEACREFWRKALAKLKAQKVSKSDQHKAIAALALRVPRPSALLGRSLCGKSHGFNLFSAAAPTTRHTHS